MSREQGAGSRELQQVCQTVRDFIDRQIYFRPCQGCWRAAGERRVVLGFRNYFCLMINILLLLLDLGRQDTGCQGSWDHHQPVRERILYVFITFYVKLVSKERLQHPAQPDWRGERAHLMAVITTQPSPAQPGREIISIFHWKHPACLGLMANYSSGLIVRKSN